MLLLLQVKYLGLTGLSGPQFAAVLGHGAQAMSTFSTLHSLIGGVLNETDSRDVAAAAVQAVYDRVKVAASTDAAQVGQALLLGAGTVLYSGSAVACSICGACEHLVSYLLEVDGTLPPGCLLHVLCSPCCSCLRFAAAY